MQLSRFENTLDLATVELPLPRDLPTRRKKINNDPLRATIIALAALGLSLKDIANITGLHENKVKEFEDDTSAAAALANARVAATAYRLAVSGDAPKATIAWLKSRAGWKDDGATINNNLMINWPLPPSPKEQRTLEYEQ